MKSTSAACASDAPPVSISALTERSGSISGAGAIRYPSRSEGNITFEKVAA